MYSVNMQERTGTNVLKDTDLYVVAITVVLCTFVRILYTTIYCFICSRHKSVSINAITEHKCKVCTHKYLQEKFLQGFLNIGIVQKLSKSYSSRCLMLLNFTISLYSVVHLFRFMHTENIAISMYTHVTCVDLNYTNDLRCTYIHTHTHHTN